MLHFRSNNLLFNAFVFGRNVVVLCIRILSSSVKDLQESTCNIRQEFTVGKIILFTLNIWFFKQVKFFTFALQLLMQNFYR